MYPVKTQPTFRTHQSYWWVKTNSFGKPNKQPNPILYSRNLLQITKPIRRPMRRLTIKIIYGTKQ